jgi:carboxypeptidase C (cathepsin A)
MNVGLGPLYYGPASLIQRQGNKLQTSKAHARTFAALLASTLLASGLQAEEKAAETPIPDPQSFVTEHSGRFNGVSLKYRVTAGETYLRDKDGKPKASIFAFAYTRTDGKSPRPVTFVWNGGPGSASLWLHMGTLGPKRISVPSDARHAGPPPYPVFDAPETLLDVTDLVFVDPVGTGYSRALGTHKGKEFWGLKEDAQSMAEFIRTWVTDNGRWNAPRFLLGESFGTTRAALVARLLEGGDFMMSLNGLIFVSQALDYAGSTPYLRDNLIANVTYLPTMAAAAWYHGKVSPKPASLEAFLMEARAFATNELLPALFKGNTLDAATRIRVRDGLARFTRLSPQYIERTHLRVQGFRFAKELLREEGKVVGLLDARYTTSEVDTLTAEPSGDAASTAISAAFKSALMDYMRTDLKISWDRLYLAPADEELGPQWRWRTVPDDQYWEPFPVNTAGDLSAALRLNPSLRVLVASGYYDLVTPFFDAEYTLNRHDIDASRVDYKYYGGGHMMYVNEPSRTQLLNDARQFIVSQQARRQ